MPFRNMHRAIRWSLLLGSACLLGLPGRAAVDFSKMPPAAPRPVDFAKDIQPIFEQACYQCHGPNKHKGGLRLDRRADALRGGDNYAPAIIPGKPLESPLLQSVSQLDEDFRMPDDGEPLTAEQVGLLRAWIEQGAIWPADGSSSDKDNVPWSFRPIAPVPVPATAATTMPIRTPVDAFVFAKLADHNLQPSAEADPRALIKRAALVLTGLPPTPEEVETFAHDRDPRAYEKLVDRLLASPRFGEQWAQHWLDVVRFAETNGSESNLYRKNAWAYRDYVIRAFNDDLPLDRFVREQIAGDVLGVDEATGFLVSGLFVTPDTVGKEEQAIKQARADRLEETIQGVSAALLGVTVGCARCHNHKFDPIPQKDYYALAAIFQGLEYGPRPWLTRPDTKERAAKAAVVRGQMDALRAELRRASPEAWTEEWPSHLQTHFRPVTAKALRITFPAEFAGAIDELEIYGAATGDTNLALAANGGTARSYKPKENADRPITNVIDGVKDHYRNWRAREGVDARDPAWFEIELPHAATIDHLAISTDRDTIETTDYLSDRTPTGPRKYTVEARNADGTWHEIAHVDLGGANATETAAARRKKMAAAFGASANAKSAASGDDAPPARVAKKKAAPPPRPATPRDATIAKINALAKTYCELLPPPIFAGYFVEPKPLHLLGRGDPMNPREEVAPNALSALHADLGLTSSAPDRARRIAFADWLTDPRQNPLTPRVLANRLWLHVFGKGIVETPGDFGNVGDKPSNPALLDWLATELIQRGWSAKSIVRLLVTSSVFRQASTANPAAAQIDADARLLWRFPPRRAEAEMIRDRILAAAGTLDLTMGGPGFRIHGDKRRFESWKVIDNAGPSTWRRMIYQERMRGIDDQMFTAFDRPECGQVVPKRTISTTPLQALNLLNGAFVVTQSEKLAERATREAHGDGDEARVRRVFELALLRAPTAAELAAATALVRANDLAALCRAVLNSNEFAFIE